jgi:hypothetical protein
MGLIEPGRDRSALTDDLFARFAGRIAADPRKHEPYMAVAVGVVAGRWRARMPSVHMLRTGRQKVSF